MPTLMTWTRWRFTSSDGTQRAYFSLYIVKAEDLDKRGVWGHITLEQQSYEQQSLLKINEMYRIQEEVKKKLALRHAGGAL